MGCSKKQYDSNCLSYSKAPVTKVEGSAIASANQEISLTVSFVCYNGCGQFGNLEEVIAGNETTIIIHAKYEGCICIQDVPIRQTLYKFKKSKPGAYYLKFFKGENTYLTHAIIVQ